MTDAGAGRATPPHDAAVVGATSSGPRRLSVNISQATADALTEMRTREGISATEAIRRLIGYGDVVYQAVVAGREVVLRGGGRPVEKLVLLDPPVLGKRLR